mmetsp:Transcript_42371/g.61904  ORF Transcript_42371/g.61904 Transcript_42371/m.61904 type:complete len:272 (+) Transcript_42371:1874-2689(+)
MVKGAHDVNFIHECVHLVCFDPRRGYGLARVEPAEANAALGGCGDFGCVKFRQGVRLRVFDGVIGGGHGRGGVAEYAADAVVQRLLVLKGGLAIAGGRSVGRLGSGERGERQGGHDGHRGRGLERGVPEDGLGRSRHAGGQRLLGQRVVDLLHGQAHLAQVPVLRGLLLLLLLDLLEQALGLGAPGRGGRFHVAEGAGAAPGELGARGGVVHAAVLHLALHLVHLAHVPFPQQVHHLVHVRYPHIVSVPCGQRLSAVVRLSHACTDRILCY